MLAAVAGGEQEHRKPNSKHPASLQSLACWCSLDLGIRLRSGRKERIPDDIEQRWSRTLDALERNIGLLDEERQMPQPPGRVHPELGLFDKTGPSSRVRTVSSEVEPPAEEKMR